MNKNGTIHNWNFLIFQIIQLTPPKRNATQNQPFLSSPGHKFCTMYRNIYILYVYTVQGKGIWNFVQFKEVFFS